MASEIASALRSAISPEEKARVAQKSTDNPDAYELYVRGREVQLRPETSRENYLSAIDFYKRAVALDPKFVVARARLSFMQELLYEFFEPTNASLLIEAKQNAEEALRLDTNSAEAHLASARCAFDEHDETTAKTEVSAALRLNPNDATLYIYARVGEIDRAWAGLERLMASPFAPYLNTLRLDPLYDPLRNDPRFQKLTATGKL